MTKKWGLNINKCSILNTFGVVSFQTFAHTDLDTGSVYGYFEMPNLMVVIYMFSNIKKKLFSSLKLHRHHGRVEACR